MAEREVWHWQGVKKLGRAYTLFVSEEGKRHISRADCVALNEMAAEEICGKLL